MRIGYARVSTIGQNLEAQLEKLQDCEKVFAEKVSASNGKRLELEKCLEFVRAGDTLFVTRLDRLARSTLDLCQIAEKLEKKNVELCVIDQNINTADATGRLLFNMLGAIAQFETELRAERQRDGIVKARERGVKFGNKPKLAAADVARLNEKRAQGALIKDLMQEFRLSKATVYRYLVTNQS
jgi:DNA invertase Pin-like site-specific DNA recombinase